MNRAEAVRITINTPGWEHIRQMMETRIEQARLTALVNTDRNQVLALWDRAQAADQLFRSLLQDVENLTAGIGQENSNDN